MKIKNAEPLPNKEVESKVNFSDLRNALSKSKPDHTSIIQLPSKGRLYEGKSTVEISFLTTLDVKRLYNINRGTSTDSIERLLQSKIHDFNAFDLTVSDLWFVAYWIRINSYSRHPLRVEWTCHKTKNDGTVCQKLNLSEIRASNLEYKEFDDNFQEPATLSLSDFGPVKVRLPRVKDETDSIQFVNNLPSDSGTDGDIWLCRNLCLIDNGMSLPEKYKLAKTDKITANDIFDLSNFADEFNYGVRDSVTLECAGCREVSRVPFQLRYKDFIPSPGHTSDIRNAITFNDSCTSGST